MKISGPKGKLNYLDNGNVKIQFYIIIIEIKLNSIKKLL